MSRTTLSLGNFFFSLFVALVGYILFLYLSTRMSTTEAGLVVAGGALISLVAFPFLPRLSARYHPRQVVVYLSLVTTALLVALLAADTVCTIAVIVALIVAIQPVLSYELDLLFEAMLQSPDGAGTARSAFLTAWNFAIILSPLVVAAILASQGGTYEHVFLLAGVSVGMLGVLFSSKWAVAMTAKQPEAFFATVSCLSHDEDLRATIFGHFLLYLFFVWAPLYTPIYLHVVLGIPWSTLGPIFAIILIPYIVLEYPIGWLADNVLGDKEMMLAGFLLAGGALAALGSVTTATSITTIVVILFISRIGTSLVESTNEAHFFRRVSAKDINSVSIFRGVWPLANLVAPLIGSAVLLFGSYPLLFFVAGGSVALLGTFATLRITDFR
jgi:MFS family permease